MRSKLSRHIGSLSLLGVSVSLLGCFAEASSSVGAVPKPSMTTVEARVAEADENDSDALGKAPNHEPVPAKLAEIVKLADANVADEVILAFIHRERQDYKLTADEVLFLQRRGLNEGIIAALIRNSTPEQGVPSEPTAPVASVTMASPSETPPTPSGAAPEAQEATPYFEPSTVVTQYVSAVEAPEPTTVSYFNTYLSPHGSWVNISGYGNCWQPTIVLADPTWQPYCNGGCWVWSDSGWYWQSDYSWGWAAFHYGRWWKDHRAGWVWAPGSVWAPAWVSWRNSTDYCGWAPLPPSAYYAAGIGLTYRGGRVGVNFGFGLGAECYSFVEARHLDDHAWHRYRVGPRETGIIFAKTKPINRYEQGPHGTINRGIAPEWFSHDSDRRSRIPVKLDEISSTGGTRPDSWRDQGRALAVLRPQDIGKTRPVPSENQRHTSPSPRLFINNVPADSSFNQRSSRSWSQNHGASQSQGPAQTQTAQTEARSRSFDTAPARRDPDHSGRLIMEKLSPRPTTPGAAASPSDPVQTPRPFVNSRSNSRPLQPPRESISEGPATRSQQPAPPQPSIQNTTPRFSPPSPAASGSFGRPASRSGSLQPVGPQLNRPPASAFAPQTRVFAPTPIQQQAPVQSPRPLPPSATFQPRFAPPEAPVMSRSSAPRFQAPSSPTVNQSTGPGFQTQSRSSQNQTRPGRGQ